MSKKDGGSAFPITVGCDNIGEVFARGCEGMTLRDYFAAHALAGVMIENESHLNNDDIVAFSYAIADRMISFREDKA